MIRSAPIAVLAIAATAVLAPAMSASAARTPPAGSYQNSCAQISLSNAGILTAQCQNRMGRYVPASLRMTDCGPGDVTNLNGGLTCQPAYGGRDNGRDNGRRGEGRGQGRGNRQASIVLYEAANYQGRGFEARGDVDRLDQFNDVTSSIRVDGGEWQVCSAAYYRGTCIVVSRNEPNMARFNINDQISSVRRIR